MDCKDYLPLVEKLADGEVTPTERRRTEDHLQTCEDCRAHLLFLESLAVAAREASPPSPPESYWEVLPGKIMTRIAEGEENRKRSPRGFFGFLSPSGLRWAGALAAAVVAAVVGLRVLDVPLSSPGPSADLLQRPSPASRDSSGKMDQPAAESLAASEEQAAGEAGTERETEPPSEPAAAPPVAEMRLGDERSQESDRVLGAEAFDDRAGNELLRKERAAGSVVAPGGAEPAAPKSVDESAEKEVVSDRVTLQATRQPASEQATPSPAGVQALAGRPDEGTESRLQGAPSSPTAEEGYRALVERYPLERFEAADRLAASLKEEASNDKSSECVAWRQFVEEHRGSELETSARYRLALCAIALSEMEPSEDLERQAREESQAFLALEPSGVRADEIRRALAGIER